MEMVLVPAGEFLMGEKGIAEPVHPVKITRPFYIGKYHVTVGQFRAFADAAKFQTDAEKAKRASSAKDGKWEEMSGISWRTPGFKQTDTHPVCTVSWNDAQEFCRWARKVTGFNVCLPTEAQWEYAARGPRSLKYPWGDKWDGTRVNHADVTWRKSDAVVQEWGASNDNDGVAWTAPVGSYKNASWCGAFDMVGNAWQRCEDFYDGKYYQESPSADPKGPGTGEGRVVRGGSWNNVPGQCLTALRHRHDPGSRDAGLGFRIVVLPARNP
jgi:formylglycine-generating enzyme required for sulfatase activity